MTLGTAGHLSSSLSALRPGALADRRGWVPTTSRAGLGGEQSPHSRDPLGATASRYGAGPTAATWRASSATRPEPGSASSLSTGTGPPRRTRYPYLNRGLAAYRALPRGRRAGVGFAIAYVIAASRSCRGRSEPSFVVPEGGWRRQVRRWARLFRTSAYTRVGGRPLFIILDAGNFMTQWAASPAPSARLRFCTGWGLMSRWERTAPPVWSGWGQMR
jgi:hypothetical protein